jgi:hypothetical protein
MFNLLVAGVLGLAALAVAARWLAPRLAFFPTAGEQQTPAALGLPFETATLTTADGERLRAWLLPNPGAAAFVVYFHGNGGNLSAWLPILAGIQRQGLAVAAIDYRGYGASTGRPSEHGLYRDVDAALDWTSRLVNPGVPIVYWGRSLGTAMAAYAATKRTPDGLILEAGFASARRLLRGSPPLALLALFSSYRFPTAALARRARSPVLVVHGEDDHVVPIANGRELYESLAEPKRFHVVAGGDHNDAEPSDPRRYWEAVREFVAGIR